jgi:hypothetical protein
MGNLVKLDFIPKFYLLITDVTWKFLRPSPLAPLPKGEGDKSFLDFAPPLLSGRGAWGVRAIFIPRNIS